MAADAEAEPLLQRRDRLLEPRVVKWDQQPAGVAHEVVMMLVLAVLELCALVAGNPVADLHAHDQPELSQEIDPAVHAGDADWSRDDPLVEPTAQASTDRLGAERTMLAREHLDQELARATAAVARATDKSPGAPCPLLVLGVEPLELLEQLELPQA